jgi:excisionase family DNA binding protein
MNPRPVEIDSLLTPGEVAAMFRVDPKTVTRWAQAGKVSSIRTLGGHRRFLESEVRALMAGMSPQRDDAAPEQARRVPQQRTRRD